MSLGELSGRIWVQAKILEFTVALGGIWRSWSFQRSRADGDFRVCGDSRACDLGHKDSGAQGDLGHMGSGCVAFLGHIEVLGYVKLLGHIKMLEHVENWDTQRFKGREMCCERHPILSF